MTIATAWFFLAVWEISVVVGPFTTQGACEAQRAMVKAATRVSIPGTCWEGPVVVGTR
jgi:hypothetical protein